MPDFRNKTHTSSEIGLSVGNEKRSKIFEVVVNWTVYLTITVLGQEWYRQWNAVSSIIIFGQKNLLLLPWKTKV